MQNTAFPTAKAMFFLTPQLTPAQSLRTWHSPHANSIPRASVQFQADLRAEKPAKNVLPKMFSALPTTTATTTATTVATTAATTNVTAATSTITTTAAVAATIRVLQTDAKLANADNSNDPKGSFFI